VGLGSCPKCWDNPCTCGYQYQGWTKEKKLEVIRAIMESDKKDDDDWGIGSMIFGGKDE